MPEVLAFPSPDDTREVVRGVTAALGRTLRLATEARTLPTSDDRAIATVLAALDEPDVRLGVLPYDRGHAGRLVTEVMARCRKPLVVVPVDHAASTPERISRVLVPLDGTLVSAETVESAVALFAASGADTIVLHVFDETTVPKFWDQAAHARRSWDEQFLSRYCRQPGARLELRTGNPGEQILDVAASEHADLIALGWTQNVTAGRALTLRTTVEHASTPVLMLPVDGGPGPDRWQLPSEDERVATS